MPEGSMFISSKMADIWLPTSREQDVADRTMCNSSAAARRRVLQKREVDMSATTARAQPIGAALPDWSTRPRPPRTTLEGRLCRLEMLEAERHTAELFAANRLDTEGRNWTYLAYGPFDRLEDYRGWVEKVAAADDPLFHAIIDLSTGKAAGVASLMRIDPANGVIEVGHINYSPLLQRKPAATEAMFLLMRRVFDELGYRRYEWKCDSLNVPSRAAALRLGFQYEGLFRQASVYKGRNRDTVWYSIIDGEWPALKRAYGAWLAPANLDGAGQQRQSLGALIAAERGSVR
jgi:RimJ/RimL family protein N-acetyltransferase